MRSTASLVCFSGSFEASALEADQPPGTYRVAVDEEQLDCLSFVADRCIASLLHIPAIEGPGIRREVIPADPVELAAAISADVGSASEFEKSKGVQS